MNGRYFAGRRIEAYQWNGKERFEEEKEITLDIEDETERLEEYSKWLERDEINTNLYESVLY